MRVTAICLLSLVLGHFALAAECTSDLKNHQGIWSLSSGNNCPGQLEMRCEKADDGDKENFFIDEVTSDARPGAQIYFVNITVPDLHMNGDISPNNEKEVASYNPSEQVLVDLVKDCGGLLGCGRGSVKHQIQFNEAGALVSKIWSEDVACQYSRTHQ